MLRLIFFSLFFCSILGAKETICLNMIVKNEAPVIERCLESVKSIIDYWVIMDTGSSDGTQEIIKNYLKDIPGELYEKPWKNFGESRSEAFDLARHKGEYILFMDADDILVLEREDALAALDEGLYHMWRGVEGFSYLKPQLVRGDLPWQWIGVTHEYLSCNEPYTTDTLENVKYVSCEGGNRSEWSGKFWENIRLLEAGLKKEPQNERYAFYLAESYRDAGEKGKALEWFQNRIERGGWGEEVFWSYLQCAHMLADLGLSSNIVIDAYMNAHRYRPHRAEPIYYLADLWNREEKYEKAYAILKSFAEIPRPEEKDSLFNCDWIEDYGLAFQRSICAFYAGEYEEALELSDQLLANPSLPESYEKLVQENRQYPLDKLKEAQ